MRAGIGLLSLLLAAAIIFYISFGGKNGGYEGTVLKQGHNAQEQASQIAGRTGDDIAIADTIQMDEVDASGQFRRLKVISIIPQTPMETAYGLKAGDEIIKVGDLGVADNNDAGLGKACVYEAYQRNETLTILRGDQQITLTPNTPLAKYNPKLFSNIGSAQNQGTPTAVPGVAIPTH